MWSFWFKKTMFEPQLAHQDSYSINETEQVEWANAFINFKEKVLVSKRMWQINT
jgi:hypothetical protein